jgi:hypothetical protein
MHYAQKKKILLKPQQGSILSKKNNNNKQLEGKEFSSLLISILIELGEMCF